MACVLLFVATSVWRELKLEQQEEQKKKRKKQRQGMGSGFKATESQHLILVLSCFRNVIWCKTIKMLSGRALQVPQETQKN